ncbi:MAG: carbamoyl phosphate synthase small subunit [Micavibrio sp.]|nr:carbamoyl phosphate synthase small subunit [Micavibrio sp.]|tara:strand:- start:31067 stop:32263 length:1197 start_codon:yes stop_codon:yes gene_type:complete
MPDFSSSQKPKNATACLLLNDGTLIWGYGIGAETTKIGEVCFNTSMTGYQEILTDPSYARQIITFTFPHIGNVGTNAEDIETLDPACCGLVLRERITDPSNWRSTKHLDAWLKDHDLPGITGVDTRALTQKIRDGGAPNGLLCVNYKGKFDLDKLFAQLQKWSGLEGADLAQEVMCNNDYNWDETVWALGTGYGKSEARDLHIVAIDYGAKRNILRCLANTGAKVTVVSGKTSTQDIMKLKPDGVFLSNGPGDPAATGAYAVPVIKELLEADMPLFGICLGHQMLTLALGGKTRKMGLGHRGANHPVKDLQTGKVEITSQNHGFEVIEDTLPDNVEITHVSLFDESNEGIRVKDKPAFSVQHHPEASPGPQDSHYLFDRFIEMIRETQDTTTKTKKSA